MRFVAQLFVSKRRCWGDGVKCLLLLLCLGGCETTAGGPNRLYTVGEEVTQARDDFLPPLLDHYYAATSDPERIFYRNEYIARRMYIIDVEYSAYEAALTSERQMFGMAADVTAAALNTVGALSTPGLTARAMNGAAGFVNATTGFYDKDLIIAKTIQIVEAQMRAQRDTVAQTILRGRAQSSVTYPLSAALSDLEDYYRAGTFNSGLIQASADAGIAEQSAAADKVSVIRAQARAGIITDINKPLVVVQAPPPPSNGLPSQENLLNPGEITAIQTALCVSSPTNNLGPVNPPSPARNALSLFFTTYGLNNGNPLLIDSDKKLTAVSRVVGFVQTKGGCQAANFKDAKDVGLAFKSAKPGK
jgi:hypothetical protein